MNNNQKALLGFLIGVTTGAVAGILLAPFAGNETRRKLVNGATSLKDDWSDQLSKTFDKLSGYAQSALSEAQNMTSEYRDKTKQMTDDQ